jgi:hypothetical protein
MIEAVEGFPGNVIAVNCKRRVTKCAYERDFIPAIERALKKYDKERRGN